MRCGTRRCQLDIPLPFSRTPSHPTLLPPWSVTPKKGPTSADFFGFLFSPHSQHLDFLYSLRGDIKKVVILVVSCHLGSEGSMRTAFGKKMSLFVFASIRSRSLQIVLKHNETFKLPCSVLSRDVQRLSS